jgi:hypothetical protein
MLEHESRLRRSEQQVTPPAHPLLRDPEIAAITADLASVMPVGTQMQQAMAMRDEVGLRHGPEPWKDWADTLERLRAECGDAEGLLMTARTPSTGQGKETWSGRTSHGVQRHTAKQARMNANERS